jgi:glycosyltransferase involved in cell wall biosynthesis
MKILQVSHGLPPKENAGVELYTYYLSRALASLNHEVSIFCREEDPAKEEFSSFHEEADGLKVTRVVNNLTRISDSRIFYDNHFFDKAFINTLNREKPDLVHFQHFIALSANLLKIAKEEGYPVVLTLHDFFILCHRIHLLKEDRRLCVGPLYGLECVSCLNSTRPPQDFRTRILLKYKGVLPFSMIKWSKRFFIPSKRLDQEGYEPFHRYRYMYEILKVPEILLVPSRFMKDQYLKYYSFFDSKIQVLPLGVPSINGSRRPRERKGEIRFCYYGNILPTKGVHVLLDAFKTLPKGKAFLTIYGARTSWNDRYYDRLKEEASGLPVYFRGPFLRDQLTEALSDQEVVILPSICYESFSFVIREAIQMGLPVIASRMGAIPEAIEEGVNGFLFNPGDSKDLGRWMLRFIEKPDLIRSMASKKKQAKSMAEHAAELIKLYQGVIQASDNRP